MKKPVMMNRRAFLGGAFAASGLGLGGCCGFPALTSCRSPNGRLALAAVGTANMARADIAALASHPLLDVAALCDVDSKFLAAAKAKYPNARVYRDWREMLDAEGGRVDAVSVSTPDHMHAAIALAAMRAGKHVYCQKPMARHHSEMKEMRETAAATGVVTQLGTQIAAKDVDRQTAALLQSGAMGPVRRATLFSTRPGLSRRVRTMPVAAPVPANLDWKGWLGGAAYRPYANDVYHPLLWRMWTDFGSGWVGDNGPHIFSSLWIGMGLRTGAPRAVSAAVDPKTPGGELGRLTWPRFSRIRWEFGGVAASGGEPFEVEWLDGPATEAETPAEFLVPDALKAVGAKTKAGKLPSQGKVIECERGWIVSPHMEGPCEVVMKGGRAAPAIPSLAAAPTHYHEFVDACLKGGGATCRSDFAWSSYMCEAIASGGVAERLPNRRHVWDPATRTFDAPDATALA